LPDGSRVNAVIPPVAIDGPSITIRKFAKGKLAIEQLIEFKSLSSFMAEFLRACVVARLNIVISGGTGSGKTTLLNVLSEYIPEEDRIITIEDAAELRLHQDHVVRLETQPANVSGTGQVTTRDLVRNSLRMRPERIVVGECRGGETLDMLQAMNTGHDGSLTTLHANSPRDALSRLETMTLMSGMQLPLRVIREQVAAAIDLIVQQSRMRDGTRKVTAITEVAGMEGEAIILTDIFKFEQTGLTQDGKVIGEFKPTGFRPMFSNRLEAAGFHLGPDVFGASVVDILAANRRRK
jgi:pilus assembly protein CpaF